MNKQIQGIWKSTRSKFITILYQEGGRRPSQFMNEKIKS